MTVVDPDRWRRLQAILEEALTLPHDERERLLDHACADDPQLRAAIERVLRADAAPGGVLDTPSGVFLDGILRDIQEDPPTQDEAPSRLADGGERAWRGEFLPGTILARRYRIVSLLGRGGMGEVYRADDLRLGQAVALKFVARDLLGNPEYVRRLTEEVKLARRVSHPNVCRVYDVGDAEGRQFFSMEYVDGEDLTSLAKRIGLVPHAKALDIARQLCAGLEAAHRQGVLHRDLKPANVMLDGRGQARITDFGVAIARERLGGAETRAGTLAYMAPEQLEGRPSTVRSDLYALGLVLYELFTGTRPSHAGTQQDLQRYREGSPATAPSRAIDSLDPTIERTIRSCLERDPELRPVSASAVAAALPGGDPIRAALAAGITPSPDLVATSGADAALSSAMAATVLLSTIVLLAVLLLLSDRVSVLGRSHRDAFRGLSAPSGKLRVEQQTAVRTELDDQRGDVHETLLRRLNGPRENDRSVRCGRHSAAWIHDVAGAVGPLPHEAAIGCDFEYVEVADLIRARRRSRRIHASIRCDSNRIPSCSIRDCLPH